MKTDFVPFCLKKKYFIVIPFNSCSVACFAFIKINGMSYLGKCWSFCFQTDAEGAKHCLDCSPSSLYIDFL